MVAARGKIGFCEGKRRLRLLDGVQGGLGGAIYRGRGEALGVQAKAAAVINIKVNAVIVYPPIIGAISIIF
jgi:hypothetical protein